MKKLILVSFTIVGLTACGLVKDIDKSNVADKITHSVSEQGVECIIYKNYYAGGLSCNWDKYNAEINECKNDHIRQAPNFPDIAGRCELLIKNKIRY